MARNGSEKRPTLFVGRSDRLIARLKAMLYAWRFIDQVDGRVHLLWPRLPGRYADEHAGYEPSNIFDLDRWYANGGGERLRFVEAGTAVPADAVALDGPDFPEAFWHGYDRDRFTGTDESFVLRRSSRYFFKDETVSPKYLVDGVRALFRELPVHAEIEAARVQFFEQNGIAPGRFAAVHVRRGDVYRTLRTALADGHDAGRPDEELDRWIGHFVARTAPLDFYRPHVEAMIARGERIVFASDTPGTIRQFQDTFGAEHFIDLGRSTMPLPIQKAFLDFLLLTDAARIVGTASNFTQFAAKLGHRDFVNVAGSGSFEAVRREFAAAFLAQPSIDPSAGDRALALLEQRYRARTDRRTLAAAE